MENFNMHLKKGIYFISGIDTDIGKTIVTGLLAKQFKDQGVSVITQKLVQTGNTGHSEDILKHRKIMQISLLDEDHTGLTAPQIFSYPASPHLASRIDRKPLNLSKIESATQILQQKFDVVLLEGAGGLMVPLTNELLTIEYIAQKKYPVILVTSGRLGSINHTLLSLYALKQYGLDLAMLAFNTIDDAQDVVIANDTKAYLQHYIQQHFPQAKWQEIEKIAI